jgi:hypothetical protein
VTSRLACEAETASDILREGENRAIIRAFASTQVSRLNDDQSNPDFQVLAMPCNRASGAHLGVLVGFERRELQAIFNIYGRMVAQGVWRDYAMDFLPTRAVFSIFRRNGEAAYYRIVKEPKAARKQGAYSIVMQTGLILKRGPDLLRLLSTLEKKPKLVAL